LKDTGSIQIDGATVGWGRWQGDWRAFSANVEQNNGSNAHYIYASQVTTPDQLRTLGGTVNYNTVVGGTLATAHGSSVNMGHLASVNVEVDFGSMQVSQYQLTADFMDATETLSAHSVGATSLSSAAVGGIALIGSYGHAVVTSGRDELSGSASVNFVGANAGGLLSSYALAGANEAYSGTFVATAVPVPAP